MIKTRRIKGGQQGHSDTNRENMKIIQRFFIGEVMPKLVGNVMNH